jgi:2-dehydropantoate 2-reductase
VKICIYGAGAIGGLLGARLARAGQEVSLIARGPHLEAIQSGGLRLRAGGVEEVLRLPATGDPATLGPQDVVIIALKAQAVAAVAERLAALFHERTVVVPAVNGIPWWYFYRHGGPYDGRRLAAVDPDGRQWDLIGPERVIGCVVYPAAEIREPGVIEHLEGDRFSLGEPSGEKSPRLTELAAALRDAGLKAPIKSRIRDEIWVKLWGNVSFNPISALTGATLETICGTPELRAVARAMMVEAEAVAAALGVELPIDVERRIDGAAAVGAHKTSMLQDLERGRPMEIDALVSSVQELSAMVGVATPTIDTVAALLKVRAREAGCY